MSGRLAPRSHLLTADARDTQAVCRLLLSEPLLAALFAYYLIYAHGITSLTGYHGPRLTATAPRSSSLPKTCMPLTPGCRPSAIRCLT